MKPARRSLKQREARATYQSQLQLHHTEKSMKKKKIKEGISHKPSLVFLSPCFCKQMKSSLNRILFYYLLENIDRKTCSTGVTYVICRPPDGDHKASWRKESSGQWISQTGHLPNKEDITLKHYQGKYCLPLDGRTNKTWSLYVTFDNFLRWSVHLSCFIQREGGRKGRGEGERKWEVDIY